MLSVEIATDALARGFLARAGAQLEEVPRSVLPVSDRAPGDEGELLLMPAFGPEGAGLKLVSIVRGNGARGLPLIQGLYVLLARDGLTPELVIDGAALTGIRTAAVSALATRRLARPDSRHLVVFGAGAQASAHVAAMRAMLPIERVTIVARSPASARAATLARAVAADGVRATVGTPSAVADADVVCTCTTSTEPVFDDARLPAGAHVNAIGAYRLDMCELPAATLARALLVVESVPATLAEAGDVARAIDAGVLPARGFADELVEVLDGTVGRSGPEQLTVFKSVGLAIEDLMLARAVADALDQESTDR
ncbi:MAG TPA: ornithine cyclodeaminase family protein [Solirubrobacteraceae bacterium]|nr:ornithine cyclodeaminase family protein [Solirubrobacteraceae bacterium]